MSIRERLSGTDWADVEQQLRRVGYAQVPEILKLDECRRVAALYSRSSRFRTTIDMERYRFGIGDYRYFNYPLPRLVQELRTHLYSRLAPIANRWMEELRRDE
ncbi:MAG: 2OG-Fe(II) oxygenase, partial [Myxococcota bacterium]